MCDREKLIELISEPIVLQVFCTSDGEPVSRYWCRAVADEDVGVVADHLIANGVTVQKHGRWIMKEDLLMDTYYDCSACGEVFYLIEGAPDDNFYNYCPNCGAKMDEKGETE